MHKHSLCCCIEVCEDLEHQPMCVPRWYITQNILPMESNFMFSRIWYLHYFDYWGICSLTYFYVMVDTSTATDNPNHHCALHYCINRIRPILLFADCAIPFMLVAKWKLSKMLPAEIQFITTIYIYNSLISFIFHLSYHLMNTSFKKCLWCYLQRSSHINSMQPTFAPNSTLYFEWEILGAICKNGDSQTRMFDVVKVLCGLQHSSKYLNNLLSLLCYVTFHGPFPFKAQIRNVQVPFMQSFI